MATKKEMCSECGKQVSLRKDGMIGYHKCEALASMLRHVGRPDLDDHYETISCPGAGKPPNVGNWYGKVGHWQGA